MKKFMMVFILLIGVATGMQAETLKEAYAKIAAVEGAKTYNQEETAKNLVELNSSLPMTTCESVSWPYEEGSAGVSEGFDMLQQKLEGLDNVDQVIKVESDYNTFLLLASPDGDSRTTVNVMALWQLNFYGEVYVVYGQMSMDNLRLLQMGNVQMTHFGVSIQPMPKAYYEQLQQLGRLQTLGEKDNATHRFGAAKRNQRKFRSLEKKLIQESEKVNK